jgi:hypothetical protein
MRIRIGFRDDDAAEADAVGERLLSGAAFFIGSATSL